MNRNRMLVRAALLIVSSLLVATSAAAQGEGPGYPTDDDVNRVAKKLYCPVCPNTPLDVCETQACKDWRAQIRDELAAGWTEQQVIDYFVSQYGERVLAEPQRKGFTSLVWLLPVLGTALGLWTVYEIMRVWRKRGALPKGAQGTGPQIAPEILRRIEQELNELE